MQRSEHKVFYTAAAVSERQVLQKWTRRGRAGEKIFLCFYFRNVIERRTRRDAWKIKYNRFLLYEEPIQEQDQEQECSEGDADCQHSNKSAATKKETRTFAGERQPDSEHPPLQHADFSAYPKSAAASRDAI